MKKHIDTLVSVSYARSGTPESGKNTARLSLSAVTHSSSSRSTGDVWGTVNPGKGQTSSSVPRIPQIIKSSEGVNPCPPCLVDIRISEASDDAEVYEDDGQSHLAETDTQKTDNNLWLTSFTRPDSNSFISQNSTVQFYVAACKKLDILPLRAVASQFGRAHVSFRNLDLSNKDMRAACLALQKVTSTASLDLTGNFIKAQDLTHLLASLDYLRNVFQISLSNNGLSGQGISDLSRFLIRNNSITRLDLSGNKLKDADAQQVADILKKNSTLKTLVISHNEFREEGGRIIGQEIAGNTTLEDLDLSWNHLRRCGAVGIAKGLQGNRSLKSVNLAWNGFGFEGCVAVGDMLGANTTITELDLSCNRINPPALLELLRGVAKNKTLRILRIAYNPITAPFSSIILAVVMKHRESSLENIDLTGVVVDQEFISLLEQLQTRQFFVANYQLTLPVKKLSREEMRERIGLPSAFNVDPLRILYLLKEKMRASDFFYKINKDNDQGLQRSELYAMFDESGIPVTGSVVDKIMEFMDTNGDGTIDMSEFLRGDKRIKNISRKQTRDEQQRRIKDMSYTKYSRTFQKAHLDPITSALKVDPSPTPMRQSRRPSIARSLLDADSDEVVQFNIP